MPTIMPSSELLKRAFAYLLEERSAHPAKNLSDLLDDVSMRFNLSPLDTESLARLFRENEALSDKR